MPGMQVQMHTLGINAAFHDSAACLVGDGMVTAAAEEERFSRIKHGKRPIPFSAYELPFNAIDYCLREGGLTLADIDHVAYSFDPHILLGDRSGRESIELPLEPSAQPVSEEWESAWDPLFLSSIVNAPRHLTGGVPLRLSARLSMNGSRPPYRWHFVPHHEAHAASAFLPSPFERAAVMTLDGRGERATTTYGLGAGTRIEQIGEVRMPHSLGMLYERLTEHLGFLHSSDEYKVMALASYGRPRFRREFESLVTLTENGGYEIAPLDAETLVTMFGPQRRPGEPFEERHFDIAHSLQESLERTTLALSRWLHERTSADSLCLAGGVALNCVMNARLRDRSPFEHVWVQPAASDSGTALGAALLMDARERKATRRAYRMDHAFLGPAYSEDEVCAELVRAKLAYERPSDLAEVVAGKLAEGKIVGWFQGRMEFGPRALGGRSILASPMDATMRDRLNEIKDREDFRPVAPIVPQEDAADWFSAAEDSRFMLFVHDVLPGKEGLIPAVRHIDGTARIQTVRREDSPLLHRLLKAFAHRTGVPVLVNTSFNTLGQPIVCSPRDALECFWTSPLDALAIGPFLLEKPRPGPQITVPTRPGPHIEGLA